MKQSIKGFLFILLCVCLEGLTPIFGKNAYQTGISVETLLFLRFIIASTLLFSYCLIRQHSIAINRKQLYYIGILGVLSCFQTLSFFISLQYILSSLAMILFYFYPIIVFLLSILFDKQKLSLGLLFPILLSLFGIVILVGLPRGSIHYYGVLLAISSALIYAIYVVIGNRLVSQLSPVVLSSWMTGCTSIFLLVSGLVKDSISFQFDPIAWYWIFAISILGTVISSVTFYLGMKHLGPTKTSLFMTIEPIVTTVSAYLLLNETVSLIQIVGSAVF